MGEPEGCAGRLSQPQLSPRAEGPALTQSSAELWSTPSGPVHSSGHKFFAAFKFVFCNPQAHWGGDAPVPVLSSWVQSRGSLCPGSPCSVPAAVGKPRGHFQELNLLLSSPRSLLSCSVWLGSFPTVAVWLQGMQQLLTAKPVSISYDCTWRLRSVNIQRHKMQKAKPEIIQNLFLQQRFLKPFSKFKGPYVWFLKQKLAVLN